MMNRRLTVCTFIYHGWRPIYTPDHANTLARMVQQHLTVPHEFVCITDQPNTPAFACDTYPLWDDPHVPDRPMRQDSFKRLKLFSAWAAETWPGWLLHMDVDCLILGNIDHLITWDDFRIAQGMSSTPYNGGLWLHQTGTRRHVWESFNPQTSPFEIRQHKTGTKPWRGSDQGWIAVAAPGERLYTRTEGVYQCGAKGLPQQPDEARIVFFPGEGNKPWDMQTRRRMRWAYDAYMSSFEAAG